MHYKILFKTMSKKDYILIAKILKKHREIAVEYLEEPTMNAIDAITADFCEALKKQNPKFDKEKFIKFIGTEKL